MGKQGQHLSEYAIIFGVAVTAVVSAMPSLRRGTTSVVRRLSDQVYRPDCGVLFDLNGDAIKGQLPYCFDPEKDTPNSQIRWNFSSGRIASETGTAGLRTTSFLESTFGDSTGTIIGRQDVPSTLKRPFDLP